MHSNFLLAYNPWLLWLQYAINEYNYNYVTPITEQVVKSNVDFTLLVEYAGLEATEIAFKIRNNLTSQVV